MECFRYIVTNVIYSVRNIHTVPYKCIIAVTFETKYLLLLIDTIKLRFISVLRK